MKSKALISIIMFLFVVSFFGSVANADESKTLEDAQGDVIDENEEVVTGKDQYDIDKILYTNVDGLATIEIVTHAAISESDNITTTIYLVTSLENSYIIAYDGADVYGQLYSAEGEGPFIDVNFEGLGTSNLKFSFSLNDEDDKYYFLIVELGKLSDDGLTYLYYDSFGEDMVLEVEVNAKETSEVGEQVQFSATVTGGTSPFTYAWEFNDDDDPDSEVQNPKYTFTEPGNYTVVVLVTDDYGGMGYGSAEITVVEESTNGNNNDNKSSGSGLTLFIVLIVIVIIAGVAVVVYLIRR